jgi:predicted SnoaL-like aldol condensation-catalyzing enzyme
MLDLGMPAWQVTALIELQRYYTGGQGGALTDLLPRLLGREPIRLDAFFAEFKSSFEPINPKTKMTHSAMKQFVLNHFEEFVNRKNLDIADVNFAPGFVDHGTDVPPGTPPGPAGAKQYVGNAYKLFPDIRVQILDLIAEDDKVVVRNQWTGTHVSSGAKLEFSGIVIWRIENHQLMERWAYLTPPHESKR